MIELSEDQIQAIGVRIREEGIRFRELEIDIVDHIACLVEEEMNGGVSFENALSKVLPEFAPPGGIRGIQTDVINEINKKIIAMKKFMLLTATLLLVVFFASLLLQSIYFGTESFRIKLAFFNEFTICFFVLPLYWYHQYRQAAQNPEISLILGMITGLLCSEACVTGVFFKLMHMPGGSQSFMIAAALGMIYIPLYSLRKYKEIFSEV